MPLKLHLPQSKTDLSVKIYPVVLYTICDAYLRREENKTRVIGSLLGVFSADGTSVEVKNCHVVPHSEKDDQVCVDIIHNNTMCDLHHKITPKEVVVGWWSTGSQPASDQLFHDFYSGKESGSVTQNPIYLIVDTTLLSGSITVTPYIRMKLTLQNEDIAQKFEEIACEIRLAEAERLGMNLLKSKTTKEMEGDNQALSSSFSKIHTTLAQAAQYVADVNAGKIQGDPQVGRFIAETLTVVPHLSREQSQEQFQGKVQETLLVVFLSNLVKLQTTLADKLGTTTLNMM